MQEDLDALYRGLSSTLGEKEDHIMVEDLAGQIFYLFSNKCVICSLVNHSVCKDRLVFFCFIIFKENKNEKFCLQVRCLDPLSFLAEIWLP